MSSAKTMRRARIGQIASLILNVGALVFNALVGSIMVIFPIVCILVLMAAIYVQTKTIRRREELDRPRPDYSAIARMEREVYGEAFRHEGAEQVRRAEIHAIARREGLDAGTFETLATEFSKMRTVRYAACPEGHPDQLWVQDRGQMCPQCDEKRGAFGTIAALRRERTSLDGSTCTSEPPAGELAAWYWNCACGERAHGIAATSGDAQTASRAGLSAHQRSGRCPERGHPSNLRWKRLS